jgi:hypothetical protein
MRRARQQCPKFLDALAGIGETQVQSLLIEEPLLELPYRAGKAAGARA